MTNPKAGPGPSRYRPARQAADNQVEVASDFAHRQAEAAASKSSFRAVMRVVGLAPSPSEAKSPGRDTGTGTFTARVTQHLRRRAAVTETDGIDVVPDPAT